MSRTEMLGNLKRSFFSICTILLIACMIAGCGAINQPVATSTPENTSTSPPPSATFTLVPSNTPLPTDTPIPTDTATPEPTDTPTPDLQATQSSMETQQADLIIADIKSQLEEFGFPTESGYLGWAQVEPESIPLATFGDYFYSPFAEHLVATDFVLRTNITWETEGLVMCGLMFRSEPNFETGAQYSFIYLRISGLPAWAIEYYDNGEFVSTISDIKFSSAIDMTNGATNNLILAAEGNKFTLYINNERIGSFFDWSEMRSDGKFAFQALQEKGPSTCTFSNTWVWILE